MGARNSHCADGRSGSQGREENRIGSGTLHDVEGSRPEARRPRQESRQLRGNAASGLAAFRELIV